MPMQRDWLETLLFGPSEASRRFTQDTPVLPDVWIQYALRYPADAGARCDLLLTPHRSSTAAELARALRDRLREERTRPRAARERPARAEIAYNQSSVAAKLSFDELVRVAIPLSSWWLDLLHELGSGPGTLTAAAMRKRFAAALAQASRPPGERGSRTPRRGDASGDIPSGLLWLMRVVGTIACAAREEPSSREAFLQLADDHAAVVDAFQELMRDVPLRPTAAPLYSVSLNRVVSATISRSTQAVKADAARRLFEIDCSSLGWAVVDSGIDAQHPAFRRFRTPDERHRQPFERRNGGWVDRTRVLGTFDFTAIRSLLSIDADDAEVEPASQPRNTARAERGRRASSESAEERELRIQDLRRRLRAGRPIDWDELRPLIQVPHDPQRYRVPAYDHGTHVAGILGADWTTKGWDKQPGQLPPKGEDLAGVCPDIGLWDFRVLGPDGSGDEFSVLAALQFIRYLNGLHDHPRIHGANLSLSLKHDVANYACGRTPVCDESDRLVATGVVVVAAAGNLGYMKFTTARGDEEGYRSISITDPGNADAVITVGATHRYQPHTYGVSYFSSRGPTGDGRIKPDLVAPGEKVNAPIPGARAEVKDGTSMAAPHVSGAAALLMARHRELLGEPMRVKEILCRTATDLGRERYFQGAGMVDVLRAIQSV